MRMGWGVNGCARPVLWTDCPASDMCRIDCADTAIPFPEIRFPERLQSGSAGAAPAIRQRRRKVQGIAGPQMSLQ